MDADFNIVGIVYLDGMMAAPIEVAAQHPVFSGVSLDPPRVTDPRHAVQERIERMRPLIDHYKQCLMRYEREGNSGFAPVGGRLESVGALAYYAMRNSSPCNGWFTWELKALREYSEARP